MDMILVKLFEHNRWANLRQVDACAALTEPQLDATVHGTSGTIRRTLAHIASAEQYYVVRLGGRAQALGEDAAWPGLAMLRSALDQSGRVLAAMAAVADP